MLKRGPLLVACLILVTGKPFALGQSNKQETAPATPDLSTEPTLYVVGYAHLDTEWRWCYPQTIREFIPATLNNNFPLFDKYPGYVFNFTGSRRYQMMSEYYPAEFERMKKYIAQGRWFPCGSSVDENDANVPSAESFVRQILYGNRYFRGQFGTASDEYMLPDCFGFPAALPSLLAHCGIKGFSTQKLTWGSVVGIPFKVGVWEGPDGASVIAALDPGAYVGEVMENLANSNGWRERINANGKASGVFTDYHYYGAGDQGGAPTERSVKMVQESLNTKGPLKVISGPADWMFKAITPAQRDKLPRYKGELLLTEHSAGSVTSQAYMKRWNRKNELLADAAERASVAAWWMGGRDYPSRKLEDAWSLVLGSQMHDILPGTSHPTGYDYAWNDEVIAANEFCAVLRDAVGVVAGAMDTRGEGTPLVLYNPLSTEREDVVEARVPIAGDAKQVLVTGPDGKSTAAQVQESDGKSALVAFVAKLPPVGWAVYQVSFAADGGAAAGNGALSVDDRRVENARYAVKLNDQGDIASIMDKSANRELLAAPARLGLHYENPRDFPAWNQDWADRQLPVKEHVGGQARFRIAERGPARVALEVTRELGASTFTQTIRLCAGDGGDRVEVDTAIDWATRERSLRAAFPLTVKNPKATYDIQTGAVERENNSPKRYEAPLHQWLDLTDAKGDYGVTIMNNCKYGSDKPNDHTVRLTLLYTPGTRGGYEDQGSQDFGRHRMLYALAGHVGDWRQTVDSEHAARINQPIIAFTAPPHDGALGKSYSLLRVSDGAVRVNALKKAEAGDEVIVRLRELTGRAAKGVKVALGGAILSARQVDGQEREIGPAQVSDGELVADVDGFGLKAFAVKLKGWAGAITVPRQSPLALSFDTDLTSTNAKRDQGAMDADGRSYPAEQFPATLAVEGITFNMADGKGDARNAVICRGQELQLPGSDERTLHLLTASSAGDVQASFEVVGGDSPVTQQRTIQSWTGYIGQWDRRTWLGDVPEMSFGWSNALGGLEPGYVKPEPLAWYCSHHHTRKGDAYYLYCYIFRTEIALPKGAKAVRLPNDERIKIFAGTVVSQSGPPVTPAAPLFDTLHDRAQDAPCILPQSDTLADATWVKIEPRLYWSKGRIRYTVDGSDPMPNSSAYDTPLLLHSAATIKAMVLDARGKPGPTAAMTVNVNDVTPPAITQAAPIYKTPLLRVKFSEPLAAGSVSAAAFSFEPAIAVKSVTLNDRRTTVSLELAAPLEQGRTYQLRVDGIKDSAPAGNAIKSASIPLTPPSPVFTKEAVAREAYGKPLRDVRGLPTKGADPWTINVWVKVDKQPEDRTIIVGFGKCDQSGGGMGRHLCKFGSGVQFWSHHRDVATKTPLELGKWQMLTATYDGATARVYKDARLIGERNVQLADDENTVHLAPLDAWDNKRKFEGDLKGLTIWNVALGVEGIEALHGSQPQP